MTEAFGTAVHARRDEFAVSDRSGRAVAAVLVVIVHALIGGALLQALNRSVPEPPAAAPPTLLQEVRLPLPTAPPPLALQPPRAAPSPARPPAGRPAPPPATKQLATPPAATPPAVAAVVQAPSAVQAASPAPLGEAPLGRASPSPPAVPAVNAPGVPQPMEAAAPAAPPEPVHRTTSIGIVCPTQLPPEIPRRALQEGIGGVVRAQAVIRNATVVEVTILSGPRIFHAPVKAAMLQYRCVAGAGDAIAIQEFAFRVE